jgi:hypothetical protein
MKNMKYRNPFAFLLLVMMCFSIISSCRKYGDGSIRGTITETGSGAPFANANVYLLEYPKNNGSEPSKVIAETYSDHNGVYYLSFHKKMNRDYVVCFRPAKKTDADDLYRCYDVRKKIKFKETVVDTDLPAVGYFRLHLVKTSSSENSVVVYYDQNECRGWQLPEINNPFDTVFPVKMAKADILNNYFKWYKEIPNPLSTVKTLDTFLIHKGDTLDYTITYD